MLRPYIAYALGSLSNEYFIETIYKVLQYTCDILMLF